MKKLLEMIDIVKRRGIIGFAPNSSELTRLSRLEMFWEAIEKCHPFVFTPEDDQSTEILQKEGHIASDIDSRDLDAPFSVFSIEVLGDYICGPRPEEVETVFVDCILVIEIRPKEYTYITLCENKEKTGNRSTRYVFASNWDGPVVEAYLQRLKKEKVGVENVRDRVKIGTGSAKRTATFRKIIHVRPQRLQTRISSQGKIIEWSHRWAVRGHWRKHSGLGKDRAGNYTVENFTWVSEHEKGPENAPLIAKTRVVE